MNVLQGCAPRPVYTAGGTISAGQLLVISASRTVTIPSSDGAVPSLIAVADAVSGELVECFDINEPGEKRVRANAAISAGALLEVILSSTGAGNVKTVATGPARFMAVEAAAGSGELVKVVNVAANPAVFALPAPVAVNTTATITTTDVVPNAVFTSTTAAAVAATTPTGTQLSTQLAGVAVGQAVRITIINTGGSNAITLTAGTDVSIVGAAAVSASTSGTFLLKKTAATTWIAYRE